MSALPIPDEVQRPDHRTYFGGGDAAAILELHPYRTAEQVVKEKLGLAEPKEATYRMEKGKTVEPLIARWYSAKFADRPDLLVYPAQFVRHPQYAFIGGHPDALLQLGDGRWRLVEFKDTGRWRDYSSTIEDGVPDDVYCQCEHYQMILREGLVMDDFAHVVADLGDREPRVYKLPMNPASLDYLRDREVEAWENYVEQRILPLPGNAAEALARWPRTTRPVAHATEKNRDDHARLLQLQKQARKIELEIDAVKLSLMRSMAECGDLLDGRQLLCTWRDFNHRHLDTGKLKEEKPAIYEQYMVTKPTRRFNVKERKP